MFFDQGTIFILTCWGVDKPANQKIGYQFLCYIVPTCCVKIMFLGRNKRGKIAFSYNI